MNSILDYQSITTKDIDEVNDELAKERMKKQEDAEFKKYQRNATSVDILKDLLMLIIVIVIIFCVTIMVADELCHLLKLFFNIATKVAKTYS